MPPPPPFSPARVFAELVSPPVDSGTGEDEPARAALGGPPLGREVHVSGSAELSARPDRAKVTVYLKSRKGEAGAAQSSVARRLDYIVHTVRQRGGISENDVTVTKNFSRIENAYKMEAEVCIIFTDFGKMQDTCNHLVEKLDKSVIISSPHFYHTVEAIDTLRKEQVFKQILLRENL